LLDSVSGRERGNGGYVLALIFEITEGVVVIVDLVFCNGFIEPGSENRFLTFFGILVNEWQRGNIRTYYPPPPSFLLTIPLQYQSSK
jgi:hypothetical protein